MISKKQARKRSVKPPSSSGSKKDDENEFGRDEEVEGEEQETGKDFGGGFKLEPFHLRKEREGGFFKDGHYVEEDEKEERDPWLEQYDEDQIKKFKAKLRNNKTTNQNPWEEPEEVNTEELKKTIIDILQEGETVTGALRRLGSTKKSTKDSDSRTAEAKKNFDDLTEASHSLLSSGSYNIYSETKEQIIESLNKETGKNKRKIQDVFSGSKRNKTEDSYVVGNNEEEDEYPTAPPSETTTSLYNNDLWEYRVDGKVFGPYTTPDMKSWWSQGYFQGENIVEVRKIQQTEESIFDDEPSEQWVRSDTLANVFQD